MRRTKEQLLEHAPPTFERAVRITDNTMEYELPDGETCWQFHETIIARRFPDGRMWLRSGGFRTPTTKERLNRILDLCKTGARIYQERGKWIVTRNGNQTEFIEEMTLPTDGLPDHQDRKTDILHKQIERYVRKVARMIDKGTLPQPSNGDCWGCLMFDSKLKPGERTKDDSHYRNHLEEQYVHGSLVLLALKWCGYGPAVVSGAFPATKSMITRSVRKFLRRQLGV